MKKRRELDALVTNGKLPRRKSKSGHELLRSNDSDSSEVEEFSVPIGSKAGKKWIGICPCSSCVALLVFIVMTSCLIACGGLIWMHFELKRDLDNLRERLLTVENRNQGAPEEFQKYHTQIQDLNRTVHNIKTGDRGIDKITKNLTDIFNQLNNLNKVTKALNDSLDEAPHLKNLPKQFKTLTSTVVKIGSDIQSAQGKVETLEEFKKTALEDLANLKKKVADMENKTQTPSTAQPLGREHGSSPVADNSQVTQKLEMLALDIDSLNKSLISRFGTLNSTLLIHETRLSLLENYTSRHISTPVKNTNTLKQLLGGDSKTPTDGEMSVLTTLVDKVDNITIMVANLGHLYDKLQSDISSVNASVSTSAVSSSDLPQTDILSSVEYLNSTVLKLSDHFDKLNKLFIKNRNELTNTTTYVNGILRYLALSDNATHGTSQLLPTGTVTTPTPAGSTTTGTPAPTSPPAIKMELVKNMSDLEKSFNRWDRQGTGQVNPDDLQDYMPDPPTPEQLKPFDEDNNGKYSLKEFAVALGFKSETKEEVDHIFE